MPRAPVATGFFQLMVFKLSNGRYSDSERTDEEKFNAINWQEIVTAIEATQENPSKLISARGPCALAKIQVIRPFLSEIFLENDSFEEEGRFNLCLFLPLIS